MWYKINNTNNKTTGVLRWRWSHHTSTYGSFSRILSFCFLQKSWENAWALTFPVYSWVLRRASGLKKKVKYTIYVCWSVFLVDIYQFGTNQKLGKCLVVAFTYESKHGFPFRVSKDGISPYQFLVAWGLGKHTILSSSIHMEPATPRRMASLQQLIATLAPSSVGAMQNNAHHCFPSEAIPLHKPLGCCPIRTAVVLKQEWDKKDGNTTSIEEWTQFSKGIGKRTGLALIVCQLCLGCITITNQFSPSKKPVRSIFYPLFIHEETKDQK